MNKIEKRVKNTQRLHFGQRGEAARKVFVGRNVVGHLAVVVLLIRLHVEVAGTGKTEQNRLLLAGLAAEHRFIDSGADRVARFGCG